MRECLVLRLRQREISEGGVRCPTDAEMGSTFVYCGEKHESPKPPSNSGNICFTKLELQLKQKKGVRPAQQVLPESQ